MTRCSSVALGIGVALSVVLASAYANAAVTTYMLPGQAGVFKNPSNDASAWGNTYARMVHNSTGTHELDYPLTAIAGSTSIAGWVNVDVQAPTSVFGLTLTPQACTQLLAVDPTGTSVLATPVQCKTAPGGDTLKGFSIATGSLVPPAQFYSFIAVWATAGVTINSVSHALTK